jgi:uncharacterized membrane protein YhaH (DUF805 family)
VGRERAIAFFAGAMLAIVAGAWLAAWHFPGGFDWGYTVISRLASRKHNPDGGAWLSGGLLAAMLLLWPVAAHVGAGSGDASRPRFAVAALRAGLAGGVLLAVEGLFTIDLSGPVRKGHELLALLTFVGLYAGVLGLHVQRVRDGGAARWPALAVVVPLVAVGASQLALYVGQHDLGWVNTAWRELGIPLWYSFAFWQWLAVAALWLGLGHLVATGGRHAPVDARRS